MLLIPLHPRAGCSLLRRRSRGGWAALLLAAACAGNGSGSSEPPPSPAMPDEPAEVRPPPPPEGPRPPQQEPEAPGLSWAVPAGGSPVELSLKVALDTGGGDVGVNRAGELLFSGPRAVGSGSDAQYVAALARRDAAGAELWAQAYASEAWLVALLEEDGSTLAAGHFTGSLAGAELSSFRNPAPAFGSAVSSTGRRGELSQDIALLRLTPQGEVAWARRFGDAGDQRAVAITRGAEGELVVGGAFAGQLAMDEWSVTSSGGGARADAFIARFDGDGRTLSLWREEPLHVDAIAADPDGSLWIAGRQNELTSNRLWKLGADGQRQLSLDVDEESTAYVGGLALGPDRALYVLFNGTKFTALFGRRPGSDCTLLRLSPAGELDWLQPLRADFALGSLAADAAGNVAVAGAFGGLLELGAGPLPSSGGLDAFLASFSAQGALRYGLRLGGAGSDGAGRIAARPGGGWVLPFYLEQASTLDAHPVTAGEHLLWVDEH